MMMLLVSACQFGTDDIAACMSALAAVIKKVRQFLQCFLSAAPMVLVR